MPTPYRGPVRRHRIIGVLHPGIPAELAFLPKTLPTLADIAPLCNVDLRVGRLPSQR